MTNPKREFMMQIIKACGYTAALLIVLSIGVAPVLAQSKPPAGRTGPRTAAPKPQSISADEEARLKQYLDKDRGYRDKLGGYFNPTAGTYTDEKGGALDKWGGYTYKDGSYRSKIGDYWDAPTSTFKLANGEVVKSEGTSSADAIQVLRGSVEESGGYDKDFIRKGMLGQIEKDHPSVPPKAQHP